LVVVVAVVGIIVFDDGVPLEEVLVAVGVSA
jgi:hypothetical protein